MDVYHQRDEIKIHMNTVEIDISSSHGPAVMRFTFWLETEKKHWNIWNIGISDASHQTT